MYRDRDIISILGKNTDIIYEIADYINNIKQQQLQNGENEIYQPMKIYDFHIM